MHSSYSHYICLFLLSFCGFFSALEAGLPSSLITTKLRAAIDASSKWSHGKPLTFYTPLSETCMVNRTQCSIKVTLMNKITVATMTGGVLGNKLYQFHTYSFSWIRCGCTGAYDFKAYVIYYQSCYGSYDAALAHPDGIAIVAFPITTSGNFSNPKFDHFDEFFKCQMKDQQNVGVIKSSYTYVWFVNFPRGGIYHACTQKYRDEDSRKETTALVIQLPSDPGVNFISNEQFETFLKMGNSMGQSLEVSSCSSGYQTHKGIVIYKLHA